MLALDVCMKLSLKCSIREYESILLETRVTILGCWLRAAGKSCIHVVLRWRSQNTNRLRVAII